LDSFLWPLVEELQKFEGWSCPFRTDGCDLLTHFLLEDEGIEVRDPGRRSNKIKVRGYMLFWSGDIPAIEKLLHLTGVNSYSGCRFCTIKGTYCNHVGHVYFPHKETDPQNYPLRSYEHMIGGLEKVLEGGITNQERLNRGRECGTFDSAISAVYWH
jgi:hypothetical protein